MNLLPILKLGGEWLSAEAAGERGRFLSDNACCLRRPADRWERTLPTIWEAEQGGRAGRALFDFDVRHGVREEGC